MIKAIACVAVVLLAAGTALAAAAPTPTAGKTVLPPDAAERLAGGETFFNGQYVPLPLLLDDYHAIRAQVAELIAGNKAAQARLEAARKDLAPLKAKDDAARAPTLAALEAAKARQAELQKILDTQLTPPGQQELIEQKLKSNGTAVEGKLKGSTAVHPDAPEWRRKTAEGLVKSHLEQQDYEKALAELRQNRMPRTRSCRASRKPSGRPRQNWLTSRPRPRRNWRRWRPRSPSPRTRSPGARKMPGPSRPPSRA